MTKRDEYRQRREAIAAALRDGRTYAEIGRNFGNVSRTRIYQIAKKYGLCRRAMVKA